MHTEAGRLSAIEHWQSNTPPELKLHVHCAVMTVTEVCVSSWHAGAVYHPNSGT